MPGRPERSGLCDDEAPGRRALRHKMNGCCEYCRAACGRLRAGEDTGPYGMGKRMLCIVGADVLIRPGFYHPPPHQSRFARQLPPLGGKPIKRTPQAFHPQGGGGHSGSPT